MWKKMFKIAIPRYIFILALNFEFRDYFNSIIIIISMIENWIYSDISNSGFATS